MKKHLSKPEELPKTKLEAITAVTEVQQLHSRQEKELKMMDEHITRRGPGRRVLRPHCER